MKFKCDRYPKLIVHGTDNIVAQFENGVFETDDKEVIDIIKRVPEVVILDKIVEDDGSDIDILSEGECIGEGTSPDYAIPLDAESKKVKSKKVK